MWNMKMRTGQTSGQASHFLSWLTLSNYCRSRQAPLLAPCGACLCAMWHVMQHALIRRGMVCRIIFPEKLGHALWLGRPFLTLTHRLLVSWSVVIIPGCSSMITGKMR
ncbi:unnamed protein product, partial [Discosporangium mesarthrocarpum]